MKITLEPTKQIVTVNNAVNCRIWSGTTDRGTKIDAVIFAVVVDAESPTEEMQELREIYVKLDNEKLQDEIAKAEQSLKDAHAKTQN